MRTVGSSVATALLVAALRASAQQPMQPVAGGTISGSVLDAITAAPLARATVTLTSVDGFGLVHDARGSSSFALARTVTTSAEGTYRFSDLPIGAYRLRFQRLGYEAATIDVGLGDTGTSPLSIGLEVLPVHLRPVEVRAHDAAQRNLARPSEFDQDARLAAARARQHAFLSTDVRELTAADVAESATLGGSDVLRSLQHLPGVTQLDDWSAKLWVRGNRWDQNRVYYDGLPLFDPLGVLGRTAGVTADAIGAAFLHPGVRPVFVGGEGATQIELRSRPAASDGRWRGSAEASQVGANATLERARADGSAGFMVTAQHSLGHWLPYDALFWDALSEFRDAEFGMRGELDLGGGRRIEASGLLTRDARTVPMLLDSNGTSQEWSNAVGRVTFSTPVGAITMSHTIGVSHYAANVDRWMRQSPIDSSGVVAKVITVPVRSSVDYVTIGGRVAPRTPGRDVTTVGYDVIMQRSSFTGTNESPVWGDPFRPFISRRGTLDYGSAWVDRRTELGSRVTLESGLRLDVGGTHGLDAVRPAGSAQASFALSPSTRLSVGASRVHQYLQAVELPAVGQNATVPDSWLTSGDDVPVMSVDNAMVGVERWAGRSVLLAANAYVRHTMDATADDPTPGPLLRRPLFVKATESSRGVEVSARRLVGRTTGLLAYSYGHARMHAGGLSFPAPADRTHALDAATTVHLGGFNLGGAYTLTSGAPYTRTVVGASAGQFQTTGSIPVRDAPNALRLPSYSSLDVSTDYTRVIKGVALIGFAGAQNVLGRKNVTWYEISGYCDQGQAQMVVGPQCRDRDFVQAPVGRTLTIGFRLVVR